MYHIQRVNSVKKIISLLLLLMPVFVFSARISVDPEISYVNTGDSLSPFMTGVSFEADVHKNLSFGYRFSFGMMTDNANTAKEEKLSLMFNNVYAQYRYQLISYPLFAFGEFAAGYSNASIKKKWSSSDSDILKKKDSGPMLGFRAGVHYDFSQNISFFTGLGYHQSIYSGKLDTGGVKIRGTQFFFGLKFNIYGYNSEIESNYR